MACIYQNETGFPVLPRRPNPSSWSKHLNKNGFTRSHFVKYSIMLAVYLDYILRGIMLEWSEKIRVEWGDCDPARLVFYPRYFAWVDASLHHMLEWVGLDHDVLKEKYNIRGLALGKVGMSFNSPGFFRDRLTITTRVAKLGGASFEIEHEIKRDETLLLTGQEVRIWTTESPAHASGISATQIPEEVRQLLLAN